ncbi:MAG: PAS domain S-box protein [Gallionella sp.]
MSKRPNQTRKFKDQNPLRARAEAKIQRDAPVSAEQRPAEELLEELRIYQIELEMQNEALRESQILLEKSRDRYQDLYEFAPIGYLTLTLDAVISEINLTGAALLGLERSKLLRRHFSAFIVPGEQDRWQQIFMRTVQESGQQDCDLMLQRGDGSLMHVQMDDIHLFREGEAPVVRLTFADITRRDRAQETERRLNYLLDNALDMIFIFDPDTLRFVYANKGAETGTGFSREELLKLTPPDLLPLIPESECRAFIAPLSSGKRKRRRFETIASRRDGRDMPIETQLQFISQNGDTGLYMAIVRDITERKFAEKELRDQKNLLWQVMDADPNKIFVKDEQGRFMLANQAMADFYGVTIQSMIGKKNSAFNSNTREVERFTAADREVIEFKHDVVYNELFSRDGKEYWIHTIKRPLLHADGSINVLGIGVDITELKMAESKLAESYRELQRLTLHLENVRAEERARIARNLHDEMGATLAALNMRIAWLASKLPAGASHLHDEVTRISELVSSGIQTVRQVVSDLRPNLLDDVGLSAAVKDYVRRFKQDSGIECKLVLPRTGVALDENQSVTVFRIIQESLNNVSKHAKASRVEIRFSRQCDWLLLEIKDNGVGFDQARKQHSFGLLGIKERAMMIGGNATIESTPGKGTLVTLRIPAVQQATTVHPA